jgi:hypothetical protein
LGCNLSSEGLGTLTPNVRRKLPIVTLSKSTYVHEANVNPQHLSFVNVSGNYQDLHVISPAGVQRNVVSFGT